MKHYSRYSLVFLIGLWFATTMSQIGDVVPGYTFSGWDAFFKMVIILSLMLIGYNAGVERQRAKNQKEEFEAMRDIVDVIQEMVVRTEKIQKKVEAEKAEKLNG